LAAIPEAGSLKAAPLRKGRGRDGVESVGGVRYRNGQRKADMTWLRLWRREAPILPLSRAPLPPRLDWGTLVLEIDLTALARAEKLDPGLPPDPAARRIFTLEPLADGRLHLIRSLGNGISRISVGLGRDPGSGVLRLSYHWDSRRRRSLLTAENLTRGTIRQQEAATADPLPAEDFAAFLAAAPGAPGDVRPVRLRPNRCDAHALGEDKQGTYFDVEVTLADGRSGPYTFTVDQEQRGQLYRLYARMCGLS